MKVEVLYFKGCPNHHPVVERVQQVLRSEQINVPVDEIEITNAVMAQRVGFLGSPSIRIEGLDIEPEARGLQTFGFGCRTYSDAEWRRSGVPSTTTIRRALNETGYGFLAAGGVAAILASTCCLGPLILVLLGFSGAWIGNLTRLEPYRPYFLLAAIVALIFAARRIFRPASACKPGEVCVLPRTRYLYKLLFGITVLLVLVAVTFPYVARFFY